MEFVHITGENERFVELIAAGDHADAWVHVNSYWLDNSERRDDVHARLIYVDGSTDPVGFVAYGQHYADEALEQPVDGCGEVIHLVIDEAKQRSGYGRAATLFAMDELHSDPRYRRIVIAHHPDNLVAQQLYESLGFVEVGQNYDGDPLLELTAHTG